MGIHLKTSGKLRRDPSTAVGDELSKLTGRCPHCSAELNHHDYALIATMPVQTDSKPALVSFFEIIKNHDWQKLQQLQNWSGDTDDLEAYVLRCRAQGVTVVVIKTYFELLQGGAELLYSEPLSLHDGEDLLGTFPSLKWHAFRPMMG